MALELYMLGGYKSGEEALDTAVADSYVGGQPLGITTLGKIALIKAANAVGFIGLARNDKTTDSSNGNVTYVSKLSLAIVKPSDVATAATYPYKHGSDTGATAYAAITAKDLLYIDAGGFLNTTPQAAPYVPVAIVVKKIAATNGLLVDILSPTIPTLT